MLAKKILMTLKSDGVPRYFIKKVPRYFCTRYCPPLAIAVPSIPVKRWNFRQAKWSHYIALTNKFTKTLLPPDSLDDDDDDDILFTLSNNI